MDFAQIALIAAAVLGLILLLGLAYILPFSVIYGIKALTGYASSFLWPVWVMVQRKGWYTVAAFLLAFSSVFVHLYSLANTQKRKYWDLALAALHNTFSSSFSEIVASGKVIIQGPTLLQFGTSIVLILVMVSKIYFWFIGLNFVRKRVPQTAFWLLTTFALLVLVWGGDGSDAFVPSVRAYADRCR